MLDLRAFSVQENIVFKRDLEKAGTRYLLENLLKNEGFSLAYTDENKPYLNGRTEHISISHSHDKLVIILNTKENTGIDIEQIRDKVINIQTKFLNEEELAFANNDPGKLITMWAAKEAMYKVYGLKEVEFIKNLVVEPFNGNEITGRIVMKDFKKNYKMIGEEIEGYKMVYVLHEL
ncbi:4'-phosphopantetheinyl transferase family protein [Aurantibacillus circumpalustris]|uniref:4'-phosphopantetheinyl transferase family protein n=1 Tax=Aurantibacillus circumpalustris TaxID=3036359 RepID=UPI00295B9991|nr:4'-phosphopantetheinyl transferase superfamily protein [Aurantibacillus circumpalustris]